MKKEKSRERKRKKRKKSPPKETLEFTSSQKHQPPPKRNQSKLKPTSKNSTKKTIRPSKNEPNANQGNDKQRTAHERLPQLHRTAKNGLSGRDVSIQDRRALPLLKTNLKGLSPGSRRPNNPNHERQDGSKARSPGRKQPNENPTKVLNLQPKWEVGEPKSVNSSPVSRSDGYRTELSNSDRFSNSGHPNSRSTRSDPESAQPDKSGSTSAKQYHRSGHLNRGHIQPMIRFEKNYVSRVCCSPSGKRRRRDASQSLVRRINVHSGTSSSKKQGIKGIVLSAITAGLDRSATIPSSYHYQRLAQSFRASQPLLVRSDGG